jgi:hypothetical protein
MFLTRHSIRWLQIQPKETPNNLVDPNSHLSTLLTRFSWNKPASWLCRRWKNSSRSYQCWTHLILSYSYMSSFIHQSHFPCCYLQDTYCVTTATTDKIRVSNQGWYFRGCHDCSCKAEGVAPPYVCKKGHNTHEEIIKYGYELFRLTNSMFYAIMANYFWFSV